MAATLLTHSSLLSTTPTSTRSFFPKPFFLKTNNLTPRNSLSSFIPSTFSHKPPTTTTRLTPIKAITHREDAGSDGNDNLSLATIRKTLIGLEDTIICGLIERAKFPLNSPAYHQSSFFHGSHASLMEFLVRDTEAVQAQGGRYQNPEEVPFFPDNLPHPLLDRPQNCSQALPLPAASVSVTKEIWNYYVNQFLPQLAPKGDDGNYALAVASDLVCLQAISRRIHYGKYVAESKFRNETEAYSAAIRANDTTTIINLLTNKQVEESVIERVGKKATIFGQEVSPNDTNNGNDMKIDPSLVSRLYYEFVIPYTKDVEIEYLLRRLD